MKKFIVNYEYQHKEQYFIYHSVSGAFPNTDEMLMMAMENALKLHSTAEADTKVELTSIVLER